MDITAGGLQVALNRLVKFRVNGFWGMEKIKGFSFLRPLNKPVGAAGAANTQQILLVLLQVISIFFKMDADLIDLLME